MEIRAADLPALLAGGRAPDGLVVRGSVNLAGTRLRSLPNALTVDGTLDLRRCQRLIRLGSGLRVLGDLRIGGACPDGEILADPGLLGRSVESTAPLALLPAGLSVSGSLVLSRLERLAEIPADLRLGRDLELRRCNALRVWPDRLNIPGNLEIHGGSFEQLPERLRVGGNMVLAGGQIVVLPCDLVVDGSLTVRGCRHLYWLGAPSVGGDLVLDHYEGVGLPEPLHVGGDLRIRRAKRLASLQNLVVGRSLVVSRCSALERLSEGIIVGANLRVSHCPTVQRLPTGLDLAGALALQGCTNLKELPRRLRADELVVGSCPALLSVPDDLHVTKPIEVARSSIRSWPKRLHDRPVRFRGVRVPARVVFAPETLSAYEILSTANAELRRIMIDRVGIDPICRDANARLIDEDTDAGGARRLLEVLLRGPNSRLRRADTPGRFLHCRCPSTGRAYLLGVPATITTCRAAAAWLAGFDNPDDYRPLRET